MTSAASTKKKRATIRSCSPSSPPGQKRGRSGDRVPSGLEDALDVYKPQMTAPVSVLSAASAE
ncbi:unnamed protein product [Fusarium venenatum]|uniref:Uncharacterized protein n=1 Tax=Fusarium venenatum TaxID=56646 RepID=A0A2L2TGJ9_9HYPO|nr:uncharacterized protein FVRRES_09305 [Fusarium venenatum]CEI69228.1 unnamed protein product [Fusarium venenatum]